jgi:antitoxin (DNA-binding transcriptional repressor) of toxin-antitoxin stability system
MESVRCREIRDKSAEIPRRVGDGESIEVTGSDRVAAVISSPSGFLLDGLIAHGHARQGISDLTELLAIERQTSPLSSREIIEDSRGRW